MKRTERDPRDGFREHRTEQTRSWLKLSHADRLAWLEQAKEFVARAGGVANRAEKGVSPRRSR